APGAKPATVSVSSPPPTSAAAASATGQVILPYATAGGSSYRENHRSSGHSVSDSSPNQSGQPANQSPEPGSGVGTPSPTTTTPVTTNSAGMCHRYAVIIRGPAQASGRRSGSRRIRSRSSTASPTCPNPTAMIARVGG